MWLPFVLVCSYFLHSVGSVANVDFANCGSTKTCLKSDPSCTPSTCLHAASWSRVAGNYLEIELVGNILGSGGYVAIGFSLDSEMGDDSVIGCYIKDSQITMQPGYNVKTPNLYNEFLSSNEYTSDFIQNQNQDSSLGGNFDAASNRLSCRFRVALTKSNSSSARVYDLTSQQYYILLARGDSIRAEGLNRHVSGGTLVSPASVNLTSVGADLGGTVNPLAKAHGCLMILAWVLFASIGIVMARYFKEMWPRSKIFDKDIWFILHVSCQILCFLCVTAGFILIFCHARGYAGDLGSPGGAHPVLGIITFGLAFINPFIAIFRCDPKHPKRPIFNYVHFFIGTLAYVLAVPTMLLGLRLDDAGAVLVTLDYPIAILIAFIGFHVIVEIVLLVHTVLMKRRLSAAENDISPMTYDFTTVKTTTAISKKPILSNGWYAFKYVVGAIHAFVCIGCAVALVVIIAIN